MHSHMHKRMYLNFEKNAIVNEKSVSEYLKL